MGFEWRTLLEQIFRQFRIFRGIVIPRMFDDAFTNLESQVQPAKGGVALLKILDNPQGVQVVIEEQAVFTHGGVESLFPRMAEWGMAEIVNERERFR